MNLKSALVAYYALAISLVCAFPAAGEDAAAGLEGNLQKEFTVSPGGKLIVDVNVGSVDIKTGSGNQVKVDVLRRITVRDGSGARDEAKERNILQANEVSFSQD